jgi:uncharacterized Ntn-hydrolase superfamily protein
MTFSIVARIGQAYGVAVASKFIAVGSVVPAAQIDVGAVATQAMAKISYTTDGLAHLARGLGAAETVAALTSADGGREDRQVAVVGPTDQSTFTGRDCMQWAGGVCGGDKDGGYAIQGNILAGEHVVLAMERAWLQDPDLLMAPRLVKALMAGDHAGGDRRGRRSAALYAVAPGPGTTTVASWLICAWMTTPKRPTSLPGSWICTVSISVARRRCSRYRALLPMRYAGTCSPWAGTSQTCTMP